jgi:5-methyltetrahydrofolate--homocysteine methyltransferase
VIENGTLFEKLRDRVLNLDQSGVKELTLEALEAGIDPQQIISQGLAPGMQAIGDGYEQGKYFVPELLLSAKAMHGAIDILRPHLLAGNSPSAGVVVIGTVQGDVHQIGKNIVAVVLEGNGYEVHDLGEDVPPEQFVSKALELKADVVGMSALISTAVSKMVETVALLKQSHFNGSIIVGGAALTQETADFMGADIFASDAWQALTNVKSMIMRTHNEP